MRLNDLCPHRDSEVCNRPILPFSFKGHVGHSPACVENAFPKLKGHTWLCKMTDLQTNKKFFPDNSARGKQKSFNQCLQFPWSWMRPLNVTYSDFFNF